MTENVHGQDEVKGGCIGYCHGSELKTLIPEGLRMEKRRRRLSLLEVDVTAATTENEEKIRADQSGGGIGAAGVLGLVVGKGEDNNKGVPHGRGR